MDNVTNTVTINLGDFLQMRDDASYFDTLLYYIFDGASLGWNDELKFDSDKIVPVLKVVAPRMYAEKLKSLKAEKED